MLNVAYVLGILCGVLAGLILMAVLLKWMKKDGSSRCRYDERQELVRGRGFKYGFFTMCICNLIYALIAVVFEKPIINICTALIFIIIIGVIVYAVYAVWNDGYLALNENPKRVLIGFTLIGIWNIALFIISFKHGTVIEDHELQPSALNLFSGILLFIVRYDFRKTENE